MEVLQCQFSSDTIVAAAQLVNRGLLNSSTAFSNEKKRKKYRQHSFNFCVRVTALCLAQSVYSQCTQKCTPCTQNVLSVFPIPLLFNALITVLTNYSLLISCDHLMSEPELRVLYVVLSISRTLSKWQTILVVHYDHEPAGSGSRWLFKSQPTIVTTSSTYL